MKTMTCLLFAFAIPWSACAQRSFPPTDTLHLAELGPDTAAKARAVAPARFVSADDVKRAWLEQLDTKEAALAQQPLAARIEAQKKSAASRAMIQSGKADARAQDVADLANAATLRQAGRGAEANALDQQRIARKEMEEARAAALQKQQAIQKRRDEVMSSRDMQVKISAWHTIPCKNDLGEDVLLIENEVLIARGFDAKTKCFLAFQTEHGERQSRALLFIPLDSVRVVKNDLLSMPFKNAPANAPVRRPNRLEELEDDVSSLRSRLDDLELK